MAKERNFDGIQYESIRKKVDHKFNKDHDKLTDYHYNYWKRGDFSKDFQGYKPVIQAEAKPLFDTLHGLIFQHHELELYAQNETDSIPYSKLKESMDFVKEGETKSYKEKIEDKIKKLKDDNGIEIEVVE